MTTDSEGTREVSPSGKAAIEEARVALWEDCGHVPLGDPIRSVKAAVFCDACGPQILEALVHKVTEDAAVEAKRLREQRTAAEDERDEQYQRHIRRIGDLESKLKEAERDQQALGAQLHETELVLTQWKDRAEEAERERDGALQELTDAANGGPIHREISAAEALARGLVQALRLLVYDVRDLQADEPPDRMIPTQHRVSDIRQARAALSEWEAAEAGRGR